MTSYRQPGTVLSDLTFAVPLDHARPDGQQIQIFAREVVAVGKATADLPWLVYFQGGPGFGALRPAGRESWLNRALNDYRVLLLDQRGTGRSSPANRRALAGLGNPQAQADYLTHFRADAIVADAELIRRELTGGRPWSILGQSFGGFCAVTYLSHAPEGLREALITGGLPGLDKSADDLYRVTYPLVAQKNAEHYARYPGDVEQARKVARRVAAGDTRLPSGAPLTVEAFQSLGRMLGSSTGSHQLHYLLEDPFAGGGLSDDFLYQVQEHLTFSAGSAVRPAARGLLCATGRHPLGRAASTSRVPAVRRRGRAGRRRLSAVHGGNDLPVDAGERSGAGAAGRCRADPGPAAFLAAAVRRGPPEGLRRARRGRRLLRRHVRAAGVLGADGPGVRGLQPWITNEFEHDGLRVSDGKVLDRLIAMVRGNA